MIKNNDMTEDVLVNWGHKFKRYSRERNVLKRGNDYIREFFHDERGKDAIIKNMAVH